MEGFVDYFHVFDLSHNAAQSVIDAHYKRLCRQFHPDINHAPDAESRMKEINVAYEVLGDAGRRSAYMKEWLRHNPSVARPVQRRAVSAAHTVMEQYFLSLSRGQFSRAYDLLSASDKRNVSYSSFAEWQTSVAEVYEIKSFRVRGERKYADYVLEDRSVCEAERFIIEIVEENKVTGRLNRYDFRKFVIHKDNAWRVFLGYRDLTYIAEQLRFMSGAHEEDAQSGQWARYRDTMHVAYGLANRKGFLERCAPEVYRQERYKRSFTVGVVRVMPDGALGVHAAGNVCAFAGHTLRRVLRVIDILGALSDDTFCVLLAETNAATAKKVLGRLSARISREIWHSFDLKADVAYACGACKGDVAHTLDELSMDINPR